MRVEFEIFGEKQVSRDILRVGERANNAIPAWQAISKKIFRWNTEQFNSQGGRGGGWAPLAASTVAAKASAGQDPRILHATLRLRKGLTEPGGDNILMFQPHEFRFATSTPYAISHATGTRTMPRRKPMVLNEMDRRVFVKELQAWIMGKDAA